MSIIGFNFAKISIERKDSANGKINIQSRIDIEDIKKVDMSISKEQETVQVNFIFEILYEPNFAKIAFQGNVLLMLDPKKVKELLKDWKKKKLEDEIKEPVFNLILRKCNIKAFSLEEDLNLPNHFPMPKIQKEAPKQ